MAGFLLLLTILATPIVWRWGWLAAERRALAESTSSSEIRPTSPDKQSDDDGSTHSGKVIRRLRAQVIEGRVEIHWEFRPQYIHRGFFLVAQSRSNEGMWMSLPLAPHQDSGSWSECLNYGESRSYLFIVKKMYKFWFGWIDEEWKTIVADQISFSVRRGKEIKEKREIISDHRQLLVEVQDYVKAEQEVRKMIAPPTVEKPAEVPKKESIIEALKKKRKARTDVDDFFEAQVAEINANVGWSEERRRKEIERLEQEIEEIQMRERM